MASTAALPDDVAAGRQLAAALDHAIAALEPAAREVLVLRDVEGLTAPEVAEVLGVSVAAVKSRLHRARAEVRARLEPHLTPAEPAMAAAGTSTCPDIVALFSRYLEEEIGRDECAVMQRHVATCKQCSGACDSLKRVLALCHAEPRGDVPPAVRDLVRKALRALTPASSSVMSHS